jgi:pSer/pThr/pTyr-binding forkhead associated (FHA) protein
MFDPQIKFMSRDHAVLKRDKAGRLFITDVSTFGTWVNDRKIEKEQEYCLRPTDKIALGSPFGPYLNLIARKGKDFGANFVPNSMPPVQHSVSN